MHAGTVCMYYLFVCMFISLFWFTFSLVHIIFSHCFLIITLFHSELGKCFTNKDFFSKGLTAEVINSPCSKYSNAKQTNWQCKHSVVLFAQDQDV